MPIIDTAAKPFCPMFGRCGGCSSQDIAYAGQLPAKEEIIFDGVSVLGLDAKSIVKPIIPSPKTLGYRNRLDFVSFPLPDGSPGLGLREKGEWRCLLDIPRCYLMDPWQDEARSILKRWQAGHGIPAYNQGTRRGVMRYMVCRDSSDQRSRMVSLVVSLSFSGASPSDAPEEGTLRSPEHVLPGLSDLVESFKSIGVTSVFVLRHDGLGDISTGAPIRVAGLGDIIETVRGVRYKYGPGCFFQPNPHVAASMVDFIADAVKRAGSRDVLDVYCGVGLFSLAVAPVVRSVTGIEAVGESIEFAKRNALENAIKNVTFVASPAEKVLGSRFLSSFDTVIVDPPRSGLHPSVLRAILSAPSIKTLIYSSCNPEKFLQDSLLLLDKFSLVSGQPLDMFPHTPHFEVIGVFRRN